MQQIVFVIIVNIHLFCIHTFMYIYINKLIDIGENIVINNQANIKLHFKKHLL